MDYESYKERDKQERFYRDRQHKIESKFGKKFTNVVGKLTHMHGKTNGVKDIHIK